MDAQKITDYLLAGCRCPKCVERSLSFDTRPTKPRRNWAIDAVIIFFVSLVIFCCIVGVALSENFYGLKGIIRVVVLKDEVRVIFPKTERADIISILSTFFAEGDEGAKKEFEAALKKSKNVTMVVTSVLDTGQLER